MKEKIKFKKKLKDIGLNMINLRGQSSEGDQNSYFKITLSQNNQLLAFYTHCFSHSLNLSLLKVCNVLFTKSIISFVFCFPIFFSGLFKKMINFVNN